MDVHVFDLSEGLEEVLQLGLLHLGKLVDQTTDEDLGLPSDGLLLLLDGICGLDDSHLSSL